ncbi:MAG: autotransporter-associated beta strand repeat-containing protein, partial [Xanthobacteraceae bacterium]
MPGGLTILDSAGGGTLTLTNANTYTGTTIIGDGTHSVTLALSGTGSIANSSTVAIATGGTFDISQTTNGASIATLADSATGQAGNVNLGGANQTLTITGGSTTFSGSIQDGGIGNGTGGNLAIAGGTQTLAGVNTYTGATTIVPDPTSGTATLALYGSGSIATSSGIYIATGGTFDISGVISPLNLSGSGIPFSLVGTTVNSLQGSGGTVYLGGNALDVNVTSGTSPFGGTITGIATPLSCMSGCPSQGVSLIKSGNGTLTLTGANNYSGYTGIVGGTLALSGSGAISNSAGVAIFPNTIFDISGLSNSGAPASTTVQSIQTAGNSNVGGTLLLGSNTLVVETSGGSGNNGSQFGGVIADCVSGSIQCLGNGINGNFGGSLTVAGTGTLQLADTNTYTGATTINTGATLQLSAQYPNCNGNCSPVANGSVAASSGVIINGTGTFDISGLQNLSNTSTSYLPAATTVAAMTDDGHGAGSIYLGSNTLIIGDARNLNSSFSGVISDCGTGGNLCAAAQNCNNCGGGPTGGSLVKDGTGTLTLSG